MAYIKKIAQGSIALTSRAIPISIWRVIEKVSFWAQGKGWGTSSLQAEVSAIRKLVDTTKLKEIVCLDVGANVGTWAVTFSREFPKSKIVCFEPSQAAFRQLVVATAGRHEFICVNSAVGAKPGLASIYSDAPASGLTSMAKRKLDHFGIDFNYEEKVEVITLDGWLAENDLSPNVLKLDIEGFELAALQGATNLLKSIQIIQFEFGGANIDTRTYFQDFWYLLSELKFKIYRLGPKGISLVEKYSESDETFLTTNYFAVRA